MRQVWMLLVYIIPLTSFASEFEHIKLSPQFEQYLTGPKLKSASRAARVKTKSMQANALADSTPAPDDLSEAVKTALLGVQTKSGVSGGFTGAIPVDGEESPLYQTIRDHLEGAHQALGAQQVSELNHINQQFNLGTQNFSGFSWQKPFGVVSVWADRQVTPNLFGTNWLVQDTFTFEIQATTFLEKLTDAGLAIMSDAEIGAFAGLTFKRTYTYYHYADSYKNGLSSDFSKLFLPFIRFNRVGVEKMLDDEVMKRQDIWTASAGGIITSPPIWYVFTVSGGILAEAAFNHTVSVQSNPVQDLTAEKYRLGISSKNTASVTVNASIQLEFYKIIKLTLLNVDLKYEYSAAKNYNLGMSAGQWQHVNSTPEELYELNGILHGAGKINVLEPYVVRLDEASSNSLEARGSLLIWGGLKKSKTEQVRVIKDQVVKVFYKHYSQSVRLVQNVLSRLFSIAIYKIFKLPVGVKNASILSKEFSMEYDSTNPQATDPNVIRVDGTEQFSASFKQSYEAERTDRFIDFMYKNDVIWFIDRFTSLDPKFKDEVKKENIKGPLIVESTIRVEKAALDFLFNRDANDVFGELALACNSNRVKDWKIEAKRMKFLKNLQIGKEACVKNLGNKYLSFKNDFISNNMKPSLTIFKSFITAFFKEADSVNNFVGLFGSENTFVNGRLQATTGMGTTFVTTFSAGQFRGLGVIDNFKRLTGSRTPASNINE